ncbi:outer membrane protein assembly factor BamD [candidate division WOR-3 bacterium]|nr:outer membrane protein assembly factor BamD [candidate division WOR-3 bacterium]
MNTLRISLTILLLIASCAVRETIAPLEPAGEFRRAMSLYESRKYVKAIESLERILFNFPSSEYVDDAQYWLGRAHLELKAYDQAIVEFDYLIRHFSNSALLEDAFFFRARSYLLSAPDYDRDPSNLERAVRLFDEFLTRFPNSKYTDDVKNEILNARDLLARKELENGKIYEKLKEPDAALLYYGYVINNYPETRSADEARYRKARLSEDKGRIDEALEMYRELIDDEEWGELAARRVAELEKRPPADQ